MKTLIRNIPGFGIAKRFLRGVRSSTSVFLQTYPAGHYYCPVPSLNDVLAREDAIFGESTESCPGIELRRQPQLDLLGRFADYYDELPFPELPGNSGRYYLKNDYFSYGDAIVLYSMLRHFKPKKLVEIGSGFSSAAMLDTNDRFLDGAVDFTFIEPYPERLHGLLDETDKNRSRIVTAPIQDVELGLFEALEANDVLFVDSSHVVRVGSDVARIVFEILPRLKPGVIVHFHDVFWPFEYPKQWFLWGRAWNEAYLLRAFLQYNRTFQILYFNSFLGQFHRDELERRMPLCLRETGNSLWLIRV